MKNCLEITKTFANSIVRTARVRKGLVVVAAAVFPLKFYLVRELLAAELFFALGFAVVMVIGGTAYLIGSVGLSWLEQPRSSQSKATPSFGNSRSFGERTLASRTSWWFPARSVNAGPSKTSMLLEEAVSKSERSVADATSI
jgi:hypothetical protein